MAIVEVISDPFAAAFSVPLPLEGILGGVKEDEDEEDLEIIIIIGPSVSSPSVVFPPSSSTWLSWFSIKLERAYSRERTWLTVSAELVPSAAATDTVMPESPALNCSAE